MSNYKRKTWQPTQEHKTTEEGNLYVYPVDTDVRTILERGGNTSFVPHYSGDNLAMNNASLMDIKRAHTANLASIDQAKQTLADISEFEKEIQQSTPSTPSKETTKEPKEE